MAFFKDNEQLVGRRLHEECKVEVGFKRSKEDQGRKGAVPVRARTWRGKEGERGAVGLLVEQFRLYGNGDLTAETPLMSFRGKDGWEVLSRGRATQCLRDGIASVEERWREEGRGAEAKRIPEKFASHLGMIGGATRLAACGVLEAIIHKEERWSSDSFMVYETANMEDSVWESKVLEHGAWEFERQLGQGTRWGGIG